MIKEHYDGVKALLPASVRVHLWKAEERDDNDRIVPLKYPYVVLWGDLGEESSGGPDGESLTDEADVLSLRIRATYVGLNGDSMLIVCRNTRAALNRKTPSVDGWAPGPLRQRVLMDGQVDEDVTFPDGSHPTYAVDEFTLVSHKL